MRRKANPAYDKVKEASRTARRRGDHAEVRQLRKQLHTMPSGDPQDPGFRRLRYCRYADDHLLGFTGPRAKAEEIKSRLAQFLHDDLKLELSQDKTLITHAAPARPGLGQLGRSCHHPGIIAILCGHAHTAVATTFAGLPVLVAPGVVSTLILPWEPGDVVDH